VLAARPEGVTSALLPAFQSLQAAVEAGDDELAERILDGLRGRLASTGDHELADSFERILAGRALGRALVFELSSYEDEEGRGYRLVLRMSHVLGERLTLAFPPAILERLETAIAPDGTQSRRYDSRSVERFGEVVLAPGRAREVELGRYELPLGRALAVREQWSLRLHAAGEATWRGERYPVPNAPSPCCERERLAPFLPLAEVEPAELASYAAGEEVWMAPLIERTVRVAEERRLEALALLEPLVERWSSEDPERLEHVAPALRWLARVSDPGADWIAVLRSELATSAGSASSPERPRLDLPADRPAAPGGGGSADGPAERRPGGGADGFLAGRGEGLR